MLTTGTTLPTDAVFSLICAFAILVIVTAWNDTKLNFNPFTYEWWLVSLGHGYTSCILHRILLLTMICMYHECFYEIQTFGYCFCYVSLVSGVHPFIMQKHTNNYSPSLLFLCHPFLLKRYLLIDPLFYLHSADASTRGTERAADFFCFWDCSWLVRLAQSKWEIKNFFEAVLFYFIFFDQMLNYS